MKQTTNYNLNKIELTDSPPDITVLNPNFDTIDTQLKTLSDGKAPNSHVSTSATSSVSAHVTLSDSTSSTSAASAGVAATPKAVKTAYDKAVAVETALGTHDDVMGTASGIGHVKLSDSTTSTSGVSGGVAATPAAVKSAYERGSLGVTNAATAQTKADSAYTLANTANTTANAAQATADAALPLAGGTMSGTIKTTASQALAKTNASYGLGIYGGTSPLDGAYSIVYGKDSTEAGKFVLCANDGTNKPQFIGLPDGTLTWGDKDVITSAGGIMTAAAAMTRDVDSDALQLHGGTDSASGAGIWLYGKDKSDLQGTFRIRATAAGENIDLIGHKNGTLTWSGKNIVRSVNGTAADAAGNVSIAFGTVVQKLNTSVGLGEATKTVSGLTALKPVYIGFVPKSSSYAIQMTVTSGTAVNGSKSSSSGSVSARTAMWLTVIPTGTSIAVYLYNPSDSSSVSGTLVVYQ